MAVPAFAQTPPELLVPSWARALQLLTLLGAAVYGGLLMLGVKAWPHPLAPTMVAVVTVAAAAAALAARAVNRRSERGGWGALTAGVLLGTLAYWALPGVEADWLPRGAHSASLAAMYAGLLAIVSKRVAGVSPLVHLDGLLVALGTMAVGASLLSVVAPALLDGLSVAQVGLLAGELTLLSVVGGVLVQGSSGRGHALPLLLAGITLVVAGNLARLSGAEVHGLDGSVWLGGLALLAVGAWGRAAPVLQHRRSRLGVALPSLSGGLALAVLAFTHLRSTHGPATWLALSTVLVAQLRTAATSWEAGALADTQRQARTDELTGLSNRRHFLERLAAVMADRGQNEQVGLILIDLDGFKEINDALGHHAGDELLRLISPRLVKAVRSDDLVARLGGDEFALLLAPHCDSAVALDIAKRVRVALRQPYHVDGVTLHADASLGIALCPQHAEEPGELLQRADAAMYQAKEWQTGVHIYELHRDAHTRGRLQRIDELKRGLTSGQLRVHYQPQVELTTGRVRGVEALVRWEHPRLGLLPPSEFLPLVDRTGLIRVLTRQVLREALEQCARWHEQGLHWHVSVNLSASSLMDAQLPREVWQLLESAGVEPRWLMLEMTEDQLMSDPARGQEVIGRLREMGLRVSIDDYGSGYSSMAHLRALTIDELKLDKAFVMELGTDRSLDAIVLSAVHLAHALDLELVAEGVESEIAWDRLRELGCDLAQGYYLSPPIPARQFPQWLSDWTRTWSARNPGAAPGQLPAAGAAPTMLRASS
jgi:diguanylate cyclase